MNANRAMAATGPSPHVDRNGLIVLERDECFDLLGQATFGRIAITIDALPMILPVNFRLVNERVVFRTSPGSKLDAASVGQVVSFEVDGVDAFSHAGWSVVATGVAQVVRDEALLSELAAAKIPHWAPSHDEHYVAIPIAIISGRVLVAGAAWETQPVQLRGPAASVLRARDEPGQHATTIGPRVERH